MKQIIIIVCTFITALATSMLFDLSFIYENIVRYVLIVILIIVELVIGFYMLKAITIKTDKK